MPAPVALDALPRVQRALRVALKADPELVDGRLTRAPGAISMHLQLRRGTSLTLRLGARDSGGAWQRTASLDVSVQTDQPLRPEDEAVAGRIVSLLSRLDPGGLVLPAPPPASSGGASGIPLPAPPPWPDAETVAAARAQHAEALAWGWALAHRLSQTEDLYPHIMPLGRLESRDRLLEGWRQTAALMREGRAPDKLGLYVHVPFCAMECSFCYCAKTEHFRRDDVTTYVQRIIQEADPLRDILQGQVFTSVYLGGGTPSMLPAPAIRELFDALYARFDVPPGTQVVFEGNPDSLNESKIQALAAHGRVTRLTIGVQTLDPEVQRRVRRHNQPEQVAEAVAAARAAGIAHVNADLMAGLPGQSLESFQQDLRFLLAQEPDSIHINAYRPIKRTALEQAGDRPDPDWKERQVEMVAWAEEALREAGHADQLGQGRHRVRNAANIQEYDLRRQNSSLVGLGYTARSHAFGSHYAVSDTADGLLAGLGQHIAGNLKYRAVWTDIQEEKHKFLVRNFNPGFDDAEFGALFGHPPEDTAPQAFEALQALGLLRREAGGWRTRPMTHAEMLAYRTLLYSPAVQARAREVYGPDWDREADDEAGLRYLVDS